MTKRHFISASFMLFVLLFIVNPIFPFRLLVPSSSTFSFNNQLYFDAPGEDPESHEDPDGPYLHWNQPIITYYVNSNGTADIAGDSEFDEIDVAFARWALVADVPISFIGEDNGDRNITSNENHVSDGKNTVFWSTTTDFNDIVAQTLLTYRTDSDSNNPQLIDVDIALNDDLNWRTNEFNVNEEKIDVQSIVTHEIGHLLGIAHSDAPYGADPTTIPTMADIDTWLLNQGALESLEMRTLASDDIQALKYLYGEARLRVTGSHSKFRRFSNPLKNPQIFPSPIRPYWSIRSMWI